MVKPRTWVWTVALCAGVAAVPATAKEAYGSWDIGKSMTLTPSMTVQTMYDNNIYRTDADLESSMRWSQAAGIVFEANPGENTTLGLDYAAALGQYQGNSDDDFIDQLATARLNFEGRLTDLALYFSHQRAHDDRGTGPTNGLPSAAFETGPFSEPTEYQLGTAGLTLGLGDDDARFRIALGVEQNSKNYRNLKSLVRQRNHENFIQLARLFVNLHEGMDLILEANFDQVDYDIAQTSGANTGIGLDSNVKSFLIGVTWEGTGDWKGTIKLGAESRDFDDRTLDDSQREVWDAEIEWSMLANTDVVFSSKRGSRETDNVGNFIEFKRYEVDLAFAISERLGIDVGMGYLKERFDGSVPEREDDIFAADMSVNYAFRNFVTWHLGYRFSTRDGSLPQTNFDRSQLFMRAELGL